MAVSLPCQQAVMREKHLAKHRSVKAFDGMLTASIDTLGSLRSQAWLRHMSPIKRLVLAS